MRFRSCYIPTLKESPADAEVISHKLLVRAGMVRKLTSGIYVYMPTALRALKKIETVLREEMAAAGFEELLLPAVQPGDLWKESGRWTHYGKELLRFKDRNDRDYCLGPTHEEVITDVVRGEVRSYRQLPVRLFQIQTKFRDEIRPRFGLMRGREFVMKDGYSFDLDDAGAEASYAVCKKAYYNIFSRLGLRFRAVEADSGSIGGNFSHEFHVLADAGEDTIASCTQCEYAANIERAEVRFAGEKCTETCQAFEEVATPDAHSVEEVCSLLHLEPSRIVKTMIFVADGKPVAVLVRGDREVNDVKVKNLLHAEEVELAGPETVQAVTGAPVGFAGPVGLSVPVYADSELVAATDYVVGANKGDAHLMHVDLARDCTIEAYADLRLITEHDCCPRCGAPIELTRGIEVGHIFKLGCKYSSAMHCAYLDENGKEQLMVMGCYGIGVSRVLAAAIEQNHDENGIIFPPAIAPFVAEVINLDPADATVSSWAEKACQGLEAVCGEVLYDDREERPGIKFKDADLVGCPVQVILGGKGIARGVAETKNRLTGEKGTISLDQLEEGLKGFVAQVEATWAARKA
ncbi:MAG TPA: proline--tRNA ligase [Candidatus Desulfovibrio intestinipullorum]|uniref:Proline--tRNA ligase n=1 Tax=Candidatus Desulfovibrio intestinipullorum TaxID=2838536 RepID=A0A9D1TPD0_9BACT|nr:proline--tRNA ligase [Candidatus Desulfovibrio intestinipullorum]